MTNEQKRSDEDLEISFHLVKLVSAWAERLNRCLKEVVDLLEQNADPGNDSEEALQIITSGLLAVEKEMFQFIADLMTDSLVDWARTRQETRNGKGGEAENAIAAGEPSPLAHHLSDFPQDEKGNPVLGDDWAPAIPPDDFKGTMAGWLLAIAELGVPEREYFQWAIPTSEWWRIVERCERR